MTIILPMSQSNLQFPHSDRVLWEKPTYVPLFLQFSWYYIIYYRTGHFSRNLEKNIWTLIWKYRFESRAEKIFFRFNSVLLLKPHNRKFVGSFSTLDCLERCSQGTIKCYFEPIVNRLSFFLYFIISESSDPFK